jgi:hypothetical protein
LLAPVTTATRDDKATAAIFKKMEILILVNIQENIQDIPALV